MQYHTDVIKIQPSNFEDGKGQTFHGPFPFRIVFLYALTNLAKTKLTAIQL
jgi:hypothetical protein